MDPLFLIVPTPDPPTPLPLPVFNLPVFVLPFYRTMVVFSMCAMIRTVFLPWKIKGRKY